MLLWLVMKCAIRPGYGYGAARRRPWPDLAGPRRGARAYGRAGGYSLDYCKVMSTGTHHMYKIIARCTRKTLK